jgi:Family of unknown function (DUF6760)
VSYPLDRLLEEVAYVAYHFHWPYDEIMNMEHAERQRWVEQIAQINTRLNEGGRNLFAPNEVARSEVAPYEIGSDREAQNE